MKMNFGLGLGLGVYTFYSQWFFWWYFIENNISFSSYCVKKIECPNDLQNCLSDRFAERDKKIVVYKIETSNLGRQYAISVTGQQSRRKYSK